MSRHYHHNDAAGTANLTQAADSPSDDIRLLTDELESTRQALARARNDIDSLRKRQQDERLKSVLYSNEALVLDLLPVLDDLERCLSHLSDIPGPTGEGLKLVLSRFLKVLNSRHIEVLDPTGKPFDPTRHEAVLMEPAAMSEPGTVIRVVERGYMVHGRLLRPARVVVASQKRTDSVENLENESIISSQEQVFNSNI